MSYIHTILLVKSSSSFSFSNYFFIHHISVIFSLLIFLSPSPAHQSRVLQVPFLLPSLPFFTPTWPFFKPTFASSLLPSPLLHLPLITYPCPSHLHPNCSLLHSSTDPQLHLPSYGSATGHRCTQNDMSCNNAIT